MSMPSRPSDCYTERLSAFETTLAECISLSQRCADIRSPTSAHFFASVLFTTLCTRGVSIAILAPASSWSKKAVDHWDYASLSVLVRSLLEIRLGFLYLCSQKCERSEWEFRWNLFNLHDCEARIHLFTEMDSERIDLDGFRAQSAELRQRIEENTFFSTLPGAEQKKLLKGKSAYHVPLEILASDAGIDIQQFRWLYKFMSSHVHGLPLSFYRMGPDAERGSGVHCDIEEGYSNLCLSLALRILVGARDEMKVLFASVVDD